MLWRIGDGHSVHIWDDNWLPNPHLCLTAYLLESKAKVDCLIDTDTKTWNKPLISLIFTNEEATTICNIYSFKFVMGYGQSDMVAAKNDLFFVKSTYVLETIRVNKK